MKNLLSLEGGGGWRVKEDEPQVSKVMKYTLYLIKFLFLYHVTDLSIGVPIFPKILLYISF